MNSKTWNKAATVLLVFLLLLLTGLEVVLNFVPPISRDALIHHLAIPKLWLRHGGFYETPWADYSYYPMYINMLYLISLFFKNDIIPKFIHLAFGLGTGGLVYVYLKQRLDRNWGLLGMLIFASTPIVIRLSTSAYIDLGMTFFTFGSVLAFVKWRDCEFNSLKWLLISSVCMGVAVGSKYNALIAGFILNLMLMYIYAHDTERQVGALKYGLIFFVITALVAMPWYLKNYLLTGNPFYPLFDSFFKSIHQQPLGGLISKQAAEQSSRLNFFRTREIVFGETFWETLLIPLRMFFQGRDNSYQYFQGMLNPILILFAPFIFLTRKDAGDKFLFVVFTIFFIVVSYFTTLQQVRYIMPVIPLLTILAVMGIKNLADGLKSETFFKHHQKIKLAVRIALFGSVGLLLCLNFFYLNNRFKTINPWPYVLGQETRQDFLRKHLLHYDAVEYINTRLPDDAVIFEMFLGRRGYYLDRSYKNEPSFGVNTINRLMASAGDAVRFKQVVRSLGASHILMRSDLVDRYLRDNFSQKQIADLMMLINKYWKQLYQSNGHAVWDISGVWDGDGK